MFFYKTIEIKETYFQKFAYFSKQRLGLLSCHVLMSVLCHTILHTFSISYNSSYFNVQRKEKDLALSPLSQAPLTKHGFPW